MMQRYSKKKIETWRCETYFVVSVADVGLSEKDSADDTGGHRHQIAPVSTQVASTGLGSFEHI